MTMLHTAYFDASGKKDAQASVTVAGCVASARKWERFHGAWRGVLEEYKVTEFHATDFAASLGEYKEWKGNTTKRSGFLKGLIEIVQGDCQ